MPNTADADDYWGQAVNLLTGMPMPSRNTLFDSLKSADGIPGFRIQLDRFAVRAVNSGDMGWHVRPGEDFTVTFYGGDHGNGAGTIREMNRIRIVLIGTPDDASGQARLLDPGEVMVGGKFSGTSKADTSDWDVGPLSNYIGGPNTALNALLSSGSGYSTRNVQFNSAKVADADAVDLTSFKHTADSFDRVAQFFVNQAKILQQWEQSLGDEQASWKGEAAGLFWNLIHGLRKNYDSYVEQVGGENYTGPTPMIDGSHARSVPGEALAAAQQQLQIRVTNLRDAWNRWANGNQDPHRFLLDILEQDIAPWIRQNNWPNVMKHITYAGEAGSSVTYTGTDAFKMDHPTWGPLWSTDTWKKIGEAAVQRWNDNVDQVLGTAGSMVLADLKNNWIDAASAFQQTLKTIDTDTLSNIYQQEEADLAKAQADQNAADLNNSLNGIGDGLNGLGNGLNDFGNNLDNGLNDFSNNLNNGLNDFSNGLNDFGNGLNNFGNSLGNPGDITSSLNNPTGGAGGRGDITASHNPPTGGAGGPGDPASAAGLIAPALSSGPLNSGPTPGSSSTDNGSLPPGLIPSLNVGDTTSPLNSGTNNGSSTNPGSLTAGMTNPDGSVTTLNPDGTLSVTNPDGTVTSINPSLGTASTTGPGGSTVTTDLNKNPLVGADGSTTVLNPDGTVSTTYPDGTVTTVDPHTGIATSLNPDGSLTTTYPDGSATSVNPDTGLATTTNPDGSTTTSDLGSGPLSGPDGTTTALNPNTGALTTTYPDGTTTALNPNTGALTTTYPDGSSTVIDPHTGTVTTTNPDGSTVTTGLGGSSSDTSLNPSGTSLPDPNLTLPGNSNLPGPVTSGLDTTSSLNNGLHVPSALNTGLPTTAGGGAGGAGGIGGTGLTTTLNPSAGTSGTGSSDQPYYDTQQDPTLAGQGLGAPAQASPMSSGMGGMPLNPGMGGGKDSGNAERVRNVFITSGGATTGRRTSKPAALDEEDVAMTRGGIATTSGSPAGKGKGKDRSRPRTEGIFRDRNNWEDEDGDVWGTEEGGAPAVIG